MFKCKLIANTALQVEDQRYTLVMIRELELPFVPSINQFIDFSTDNPDDDDGGVSTLFHAEDVYWMPKLNRFDLEDNSFGMTLVGDSLEDLLDYLRDQGWSPQEPRLY